MCPYYSHSSAASGSAGLRVGGHSQDPCRSQAEATVEVDGVAGSSEGGGVGGGDS